MLVHFQNISVLCSDCLHIGEGHYKPYHSSLIVIIIYHSFLLLLFFLYSFSSHFFCSLFKGTLNVRHISNITCLFKFLFDDICVYLFITYLHILLKLNNVVLQMLSMFLWFNNTSTTLSCISRSLDQ